MLCIVCGSKFFTKNALLSHLKIEHNKDVQIVDNDIVLSKARRLQMLRHKFKKVTSHVHKFEEDPIRSSALVEHDICSDCGKRLVKAKVKQPFIKNIFKKV